MHLDFEKLNEQGNTPPVALTKPLIMQKDVQKVTYCL